MTFDDDFGIFTRDDPPKPPPPAARRQAPPRSAPPRPPRAPRPPGPPRLQRRPGPRQVKARQVQRVVTRIDPWAMLRVSLSFSLCVWLIIVVAGIVMWQAAVVTGSISKVEDFLAQLLAESSFTIDGFRILQGSVLVGFVVFVCGALFAVVTTVLYNLIATVFGGLQLTIVELESATPTDVDAAVFPPPGGPVG